MLVNLKKIRKSREMTLKELSKISGISKTYLNDLENLYRINPSEIVKSQISKALKVTIKELEGK